MGPKTGCAGVLLLFLALVLAGLEPAGATQVAASGREQVPGPEVAVDRALAHRQVFALLRDRVMDRLALDHAWRDDAVEPLEFVGPDVHALDRGRA